MNNQLNERKKNNIIESNNKSNNQYDNKNNTKETEKNNNKKKEEIQKIPLPNNKNQLKKTRNDEKINDSKSNTQNDDLTNSNDYLYSEDENNINNNNIKKENITNNSNEDNLNILNTNNSNDDKKNKIKDLKNNKEKIENSISSKQENKTLSDVNLSSNNSEENKSTSNIFNNLKEKNKKIMLDVGTQYYDIENNNNDLNSKIKENIEKKNSNIKQKRLSSLDNDNSENLTSYSKKMESARISYVNMLRNSSTKKLFSPLFEKELSHNPSSLNFFNNNTLKSNFLKIDNDNDDFYKITPRQKVLDENNLNNNCYNIPCHFGTEKKKNNKKYINQNESFKKWNNKIIKSYKDDKSERISLNNKYINKHLFSEFNNLSTLNNNNKKKKDEFDKNNDIMPPNPYKTVLDAREFFFFND